MIPGDTRNPISSCLCGKPVTKEQEKVMKDGLDTFLLADHERRIQELEKELDILKRAFHTNQHPHPII